MSPKFVPFVKTTFVNKLAPTLFTYTYLHAYMQLLSTAGNQNFISEVCKLQCLTNIVYSLYLLLLPVLSSTGAHWYLSQ